MLSNYHNYQKENMHTPTYIHTLHSGTFHLSQNWIVCWFPLCRQSHGILGQSDQINYIFFTDKSFKSVKFEHNTMVSCILSMYKENTLFQAVV